MKRLLLISGCLLLAIAVLGLAGCDTVTPPARTTANSLISTQNTGIWVSGEGKVTVVPDLAILSLGVEAQAATTGQAQSEAATAMDAVMKELGANGVDDKDIKTSQYSVYPVRRWDQQREEEILVGYRVNNSVTAKIRDVEAAGTIIDAVTRVGGDYIRIDSISFTVDDPSEYYEEAREKAIKDARAKAEQLADMAGVKLGKPTYISESGGYVPYHTTRVSYAEAAPVPPAEPTSISPGETEVTLNVQIAYSIG
jgi:uncharacterized protein YggE